MKYRVMIVDDQFVARQLFAFYIKSSENYEVAASLDSAAAAESLIESVPVDLIIMDILMNDGSNGLLSAERMKKKYPAIKIIAVTSMAEVSWLERARKAGIDSFWYKEVSREDILTVMNATMDGKSVYPDSLPHVNLGMADSTEFTDRELEVLRVMTKGLSNAAIAKTLHISENTVKSHIQHMLEKTGFENRTELAIEARVSGMVISIEEK